ncbi:hypothetical protein EST38_g10175 [Candolleomyces aberdarensis]|uniref:Uncharacterized protein n=1 Tax=Candolleomyces aberdarensis TaxID=2316362 RepID=A0A4Q2D827_9AGAR|nr:hypothetical protein EST38_g10175 [Candolleomyces aberdarensis]
MSEAASTVSSLEISDENLVIKKLENRMKRYPGDLSAVQELIKQAESRVEALDTHIQDQTSAGNMCYGTTTVGFDVVESGAFGADDLAIEELKIVGSEVGSGIKEFEDLSEFWRSRGSTDATACGVKEIVDDSANDKASDVELEFGVYAEVDVEFGNEEVIGDFSSGVELKHAMGELEKESLIRVTSSQVVDS